MDAVTVPEQALPQAASVRVPVAVIAPAAVTWSLPTRILFRFCVCYFGTYVLFTQMLGAMTLASWTPRLQVAWPMRDIVLWTAARVFHIDREFVLFSGSGDKTYDWVQFAVMVAAASTCTLVWSVADRRHRAYPGVHTWAYLFMRFALGATMMSYGMSKVIPLQMPFPPLLRLIEPYGNFSPMGVLWYSIGASRPYEVFTGSVEVLAGLLLFIPWTVLPGALVALAATSQIFTLNMTYDVPVKLFSFHLILMSLFLLAPDARRLFSVMVLNRTTPPAIRPPLARTPWLRWTLVALQLLWGGYLCGQGLNDSLTSWRTSGGGAPKPPLYGIWMVDQMILDGEELPPLLTDKNRWRRVIISNPTSVTLQRMDESLVTQLARVDTSNHVITMTAAPPLQTGAPPPAWPRSSESGSFAFSDIDPNVLLLDGELGDRKIHARLVRYDLNNYVLMTRGFNWVQEYPFNR